MARRRLIGALVLVLGCADDDAGVDAGVDAGAFDATATLDGGRDAIGADGGADAVAPDASEDAESGDDAAASDAEVDTITADVPATDGGAGCLFPAPDETQEVHFAGFDARSLNEDSNASHLRTVFELSPERLSGVASGVRLSFDVRDGPFDYTFRAELREKNIMTNPAPGTTQVYRQRFDVEALPDLEGPMTIFQRFNRDVDGPDIEVELTGARQFGDAVPNEIQVVAFGDRRRVRGRMLGAENELLVLVYNHASNGFYRVSLNGEVLAEAQNIRTLASTQGSWHQFGLYPHGLQDDGNRRRQRESGGFAFATVYHWATIWEYAGEVDAAAFGTVDPATGVCGL